MVRTIPLFVTIVNYCILQYLIVVLCVDSICLATESARESSPSKVVHDLHPEGTSQGDLLDLVPLWPQPVSIQTL